MILILDTITYVTSPSHYIKLGLCNLPLSIKKLWEPSLILVKAILLCLSRMFKYSFKLCSWFRCLNKRFLLRSVSMTVFNFCSNEHFSRNVSSFMNLLLLDEFCENHMYPKPASHRRSLTSDAQFTVRSFVDNSESNTLYICLTGFWSDKLRIFNQYFITRIFLFRIRE